MNDIYDWDSAVDYVNETGESFKHKHCVIKKDHSYIAVLFRGNNFYFSVDEAKSYLTANFNFY